MSWSVKFPVDFRRGGDSTSAAVGKMISEFDEVYSLVRRVRSFDSSSVPPDDPEENSFWLDTSVSPPLFRRYSEGTWHGDFAIANANALGGLPSADYVTKDAPSFNAPVPLKEAPMGKIDSNTFHVDWSMGDCSSMQVDFAQASIMFSPPVPRWGVFRLMVVRVAPGGLALDFPGNVSFPPGGYSPPSAPGTDMITLVYNPNLSRYFATVEYGYGVYYA